MGKNCECLLAGQQECRYEGNTEANIVFVFESPGSTELREHRPVVGDSGKKWQGVIEDFGFRREEFFIANAARCMIDKDRFTDKEIKSIVQSCSKALKPCLHHVKPKVIVCAGGIAQYAVMGIPITGVLKRRGEWRWSEEFNCQVLLTVHPSYVLRNESYLPRFRSDIKALRQFANNGFEFKEFQTEGYKEVDSIAFLLEKKNFSVGIDTETQGKNWADPNSIVISYQVSSVSGEGYTVFLHEEVETESEADFTIQCERGPVFVRRTPGFEGKVVELGELLSRLDIKKYMMTNFDVHRFHNLGLTDIKSYVMEIQAAAHVLDSVLYLNGSLQLLEEQLTDMDASYNTAFNTTFEKSDMLANLRQDRQAFINYASADSDGALRAGEGIKEQLLKNSASANYYVNLVHPVTTTVLFNLERNGLLIDTAALPQVSGSLQEDIKKREQECLELVPEHVFNKYKENPSLNRRRFIADILFSEEGFGLEPLGRTAKTKEPVVDKNTLKRFQSTANKKVRNFISLKLKRDDLHTTHSRYIKNLPQHIFPDNRVHPSYSIPATSSGRAAARNPNSMNWPKRSESASLVRSLVVAPPGKALLNVDASMAELRWTAHVAQDPRMLEAFRNGEDLHLLTAKVISGKDFSILPPEEIAMLRYKAKPGNFGLVYGMSPKGYKEYALDEYGIHLTFAQAKLDVAKWFDLYKGVQRWHEQTTRQMYSQGWVRHALGRVRYLPELFSQDGAVRAAAERVGINFQIQGPSSDTVLLTAKQMYDAGFIDREEIKLVLFVHDNLMFEVDENKVEELAREAVAFFENVDLSQFGVEFSVPFKADAEAGPNYAELKELSL